MSGWRFARHALLGVFLAAAALNLLGIRAGLFTSYAADLCVPAWLYLALRGLGGRRAGTDPLRRWIGATPLRTAGVLFAGSALTELSQRFWPRGPFAGVFDPLDLAAYGLGLFICVLFDRASTQRAITTVV